MGSHGWRVVRMLLAAALAGSVVMTASAGHAAPAEPAAPTVPHAAMFSSPLRCPACHDRSVAVLYAAAGAPDMGTDPGSDDDCVRCHVLPTGTGPKVYGSDPAHYLTASGFGHDDPAKIHCTDCHSIHGPWVANPALARALLKPLDYQREALAAANPETAPHDLALSVWCTGCHPLWPTARADAAIPLSAAGGGCADHPFGPAKAGVSALPCTDCFSCHAAGGAGAISHDTPGADAGLVAADASHPDTSAASDREQDGVCLRCHRDR